MTFTEKRKANRRKPTRLTPQQERELRAYWVAQLGADAEGAFESGTDAQKAALYAEVQRHTAAMAEADAKQKKMVAALHKAVIGGRVREALEKAGGHEILAKHVEERVRVSEQDDEIPTGFYVVGQDGKPRLRDGRPMRIEEFLSELSRHPELGRYFQNGRQS